MGTHLNISCLPTSELGYTLESSLYKPKDLEQFPVVSAVLRLATAYEAVALRTEILRKLKACWPASLAHWETRERSAIDEAGVYSPRPTIVHPM